MKEFLGKLTRVLFFSGSLLGFTHFQATGAAIKPSDLSNGLKIGTNQEFENLNPLIMQMSATTQIYTMVGRNLSIIDAKGNWIPQLVTELPSLEKGTAEIFTEKGVKKLKATWQIRPNAKWGDGTPITGHDVKFSWEVAKSDFVSVGERQTYTQIEKIVVDPKDPKKFTFFYDKARWAFYQLGTFYVLPKHLEEPVFKKHGKSPDGYSKNSLYTVGPYNPGLYSGPYRISEIKLGSHVVLVPNDHFYGKKPAIKKIIFKLIPNSATLESNLRSSNVDMTSTLGFSLDQALLFERKVKNENLPFKVNYKDGITYEHIDLNLKNPILQDVRVRKAMVYGLNRKELTNALFEGKQKPAIHNVSPIDPWYTDKSSDIVLYPYSLRKAKQLLDEAGWKEGKDGYRYNQKGEKLSLQLMTTAGNKIRELVEVYLQNEWKKMGMEVTIKNEPPRVFFGDTVRKAQYPAMAMFAWVSSPENSPRSTFHSESIPSAKNAYSGQNSPGWKNPEVDKLLDNLEEEFDANKRKAIITKVLYHYTNEVPVIPLFYRSEISVTPNTLKGYELIGHQFGESYHVENWFF
jgi:peptide/nickel transport system substrate-binding protein